MSILKTVYPFLIMFFCSLELFSQKEEYVSLGKDTIFFKWDIIEYDSSLIMGTYIKSVQYNDNIWVYFDITQNLYASEDNLQTWHRVPTEIIRGLKIKDMEVLPTNRIFVLCDSLYADSLSHFRKKPFGILEINDISKGWSGNRINFFNDKNPRNMIFRNELEGIVSCSSSLLYKTTDGGLSWYKLMDFKEALGNDSAHFASIWDQKMYLRESDIIIYNLKCPGDEREILYISKDFGETWIEPRYLPKYVNSDDNWAGYARNDSLWIVCRKKNQISTVSRYECLYFSSDMGKSWYTQYLSLPEVASDYFTSIEFFDNSSIGLMCETNHRVFLTFDGGERWINVCDSVTLFGHSDYSQLGTDDYKKYRKYLMKKANNKMYFFGENKTFIFNNSNLPKSTPDEETSGFDCRYDNYSGTIVIDSKKNMKINKVVLYDVSGRTLFSNSYESLTPIIIPNNKFSDSNVIFLLIQGDNQVFLHKIAVE